MRNQNIKRKSVQILPQSKFKANLLDWLVAGCLLISSADIFFVVHVAGNVRIGQAGLFTLSLLFITQEGLRTLKKMGVWPLLIFATINGALVFQTSFFTRAVTYEMWLIVSIITVIGIASRYGKPDRFIWILRAYLNGFGIIAAFGLAQLTLSHLGVDLLVSQPGRINGLSYEPSYYATYALIGWVVVMYLLECPKGLVSRGMLWTLSGLITLSLVASTSRTVMVGMGVWIARLMVVSIFQGVRGRLNRERLYAAILGIIAAFVGIILFMSLPRYTQMDLLSGTGLMDTASHSVDQRMKGMQDTLDIFYASPLIGCSLGGVSVKVAEMYGLSVQSLDELKLSEGSSVFAEILAGTGVIGFAMFFFYLVRLEMRAFSIPWSGNRAYTDIVRGLAWSLVILMIVLQLNQNILRVYVWNHFGILTAAILGAGGGKIISNRKRKLSAVLQT